MCCQYFLACLYEVQGRAITNFCTSFSAILGVGGSIGDFDVSKMFKFDINVYFDVLGKALSGKLSCTWTGLALFENVSLFYPFVSSPEAKAPGELIGWEGSVVCPSVRPPSTISNDFSSETTGPIATKFHIQPPGPLGKKSCSNGLGHMTNMTHIW